MHPILLSPTVSFRRLDHDVYLQPLRISVPHQLTVRKCKQERALWCVLFPLVHFLLLVKSQSVLSIFETGVDVWSFVLSKDLHMQRDTHRRLIELIFLLYV